MLPVNSNAKNFTSYINSGIDPRTGTISYTLEIAEFIYPNFKLNLRYEQTKSDNLGFGIGNSLMLSTVTETEDGSFALELSSGSKYFIKTIVENQKTAFYNYYCDDLYLIRRDGFYYVHYIDGRVEKISVQTGLIDSISYLDEKKINFIWKKIRGNTLLTEVNNANGLKLSLNYKVNIVNTHLEIDEIFYYKKEFKLVDFNSNKVLSKLEYGTDEISFRYIKLRNNTIHLSEITDEYI